MFQVGEVMRDHILKEVNGTYHVTFSVDGNLIGTVPYTDKSIYYVESAIDNWYNGVLTEETVKEYRLE